MRQTCRLILQGEAGSLIQSCNYHLAADSCVYVRFLLPHPNPLLLGEGTSAKAANINEILIGH